MPGTPSLDGLRKPPTFAVASTREGLPDSSSRSSKRVRGLQQTDDGLDVDDVGILGVAGDVVVGIGALQLAGVLMRPLPGGRAVIGTIDPAFAFVSLDERIDPVGARR